ncbi:MAG TPA: DUF6776 family protein [Burkholderiaceae bacterium]|nr:DUF6776 family protein [Burkholderiaceae bacterium]
MKYTLRRRPASAPRMAIKSRLSWPLKAVVTLLLLALALAIALWAYRMGRDFSGFDPAAAKQHIAQLTQQVKQLQLERDQLHSSVDASESRITIEQAAQQELAIQIKTLEAENAKLKEDLAFFESMLPTGTGTQDVAISRLEGELEAPNRLHYRLLVRQKVRQQGFRGNLQLSLTVVQHGTTTVLQFPQANAGDADKYRLEFKYYQRVEGVLSVPEGAVIKAISARVLEQGKLRAQQSTTL